MGEMTARVGVKARRTLAERAGSEGGREERAPASHWFAGAGVSRVPGEGGDHADWPRARGATSGGGEGADSGGTGQAAQLRVCPAPAQVPFPRCA